MAEPIANVVVSMPSQIFTLARSFKALANGKIYIGQIDTDPTIPSNQIQVYLENEDGSLVPIAQPIVINAGGYPVYNGQIAKFVTVQGHSMAVYDSYNVQQFYFPNVLKYDPDQLRQQLASSSVPGASLVVTSEDGSLQDVVDGLHSGGFPLGYRAYTVKERLDEAFSVKAFGAKGDGTTDDTAAVQAAFNAAMAVNGQAYFPAGTFKISSTITASGSMTVRGASMGFYAGTKIICGAPNMTLFNFTAPENWIENLVCVGYESDISDFANGYGQIGTCIAFSFSRAGGEKDIDSYVTNCNFTAFKTGVYATGANLKIIDNIFTATRFPVDLYAAASAPDDFRGFVIDRNRFHKCGGQVATFPANASSVCVRATGTFKNSQITNNLADGGCHRLYLGSLAEGAVIRDAIIRYMDGDCITVANTGITPSIGYQTYQIDNISYETPSSDAAQTGGWCVTLIDAPGGSISNIDMAFTRKGAIVASGSPNIVISDINVGNMNVNFAADGAIYDAIGLVNASVNAQISNVYVRNHLNPLQSRSVVSADTTSSANLRQINGFNVTNHLFGAGVFRGERYQAATSPSITYGTAPPTSGSWQAGSICINTAPTSGGIALWSCITSGAPGAWRSVALGTSAS